MRWNSSFLTSLLERGEIALAPRCTVDSSFSSTAMSSSSPASLRPLLTRSSVPTTCSRRARSRPSSCACSGVFQIAGIFQLAADFGQPFALECRTQRNLLSASLRSVRSSRERRMWIDFHGTLELAGSRSDGDGSTARACGRSTTCACQAAEHDLQILHHQLQALGAVVLIDVQPVGELDPRIAAARAAHRRDRNGGRRSLRTPGRRRRALRASDGARRARARCGPRSGRRTAARETPVPRARPRAAGARRRASARPAPALRRSARCRSYPRRSSSDALRHRTRAKLFQAGRRQRQTRRHRVAAEFLDQSRMPRRDGIEHVANVHAGTERAEPFSVVSSARANAITGRCTRSLTREATSPTTPWCQDSSNRHRPSGSSRILGAHVGDREHRLLLHLLLELAPILIQLRQARSEQARRSARRPSAGTGCRSTCRRAGRPHSVAGRPGSPDRRPSTIAGRTFADSSSARMPAMTATGTNAPQPLMHEHAIVAIQRHEIGDRAERDQIEQLGDRRRVRAPARATASPASAPPSGRTRRRRRRAPCSETHRPATFGFTMAVAAGSVAAADDDR